MRAFLLLAAAITVAGVAFVWAELLRRRHVSYKRSVTYDVTADYQFRCDPGRACLLELPLSPCGLAWPELEAGWEAAFLELTVRSSPWGRVIDPCLETSIAGLTLHHYVERGGAGRRIFNVTPFLETSSSGEAFLSLRGRQLSWLPQAGARLHLLRGAAPPKGTLLVLAPHPDDAEIAAFGLFSQRKSWIVTVTLGDAGPNLYKEFFEDDRDAYVEKARIRTWDSLNIPRMAGVPVGQLVNLGYFDGTLRAMLRSPDIPVSSPLTSQSDISILRGANPQDRGQPAQLATWRNLVKDMKQLLAEVEPAAIVLPHPRLDPHPDHQCTTIAMLEALAELGLSDGRLLFYSNHLPGNELYP